jgi:hypothetical protein
MSTTTNPNPALPVTAQDNLRAEYGAVSNYHSALVQVRFAGAGLYFAGLSLYAVQLEQKTVSFVRVCSVIVIVLTIFLFFLDQRTRNLMEFALKHGIKLEGALPAIGIDKRFFTHMNEQSGFSHTWILRLVYATGILASLAAILFAEKITKAP